MNPAVGAGIVFWGRFNKTFFRVLGEDLFHLARSFFVFNKTVLGGTFHLASVLLKVGLLNELQKQYLV